MCNFWMTHTWPPFFALRGTLNIALAGKTWSCTMPRGPPMAPGIFCRLHDPSCSEVIGLQSFEVYWCILHHIDMLQQKVVEAVGGPCRPVFETKDIPWGAEVVWYLISIHIQHTNDISGYQHSKWYSIGFRTFADIQRFFIEQLGSWSLNCKFTARRPAVAVRSMLVTTSQPLHSRGFPWKWESLMSPRNQGTEASWKQKLKFGWRMKTNSAVQYGRVEILIVTVFSNLPNLANQKDSKSNQLILQQGLSKNAGTPRSALWDFAGNHKDSGSSPFLDKPRSGSNLWHF